MFFICFKASYYFCLILSVTGKQRMVLGNAINTL